MEFSAELVAAWRTQGTVIDEAAAACITARVQERTTDDITGFWENPDNVQPITYDLWVRCLSRPSTG